MSIEPDHLKVWVLLYEMGDNRHFYSTTPTNRNNFRALPSGLML